MNLKQYLSFLSMNPTTCLMFKIDWCLGSHWVCHHPALKQFRTKFDYPHRSTWMWFLLVLVLQNWERACGECRMRCHLCNLIVFSIDCQGLLLVECYHITLEVSEIDLVLLQLIGHKVEPLWQLWGVPPRRWDIMNFCVLIFCCSKCIHLVFLWKLNAYKVLITNQQIILPNQLDFVVWVVN